MISEPSVLDDRYTLVLRLGSGGQAHVWLGEDKLLDRRVALKQLVPRIGGEDISAVRIRALQEARAMARVRHPAIVPIHDILFTDGGAATGDPWLVMEFIDGRTLQNLIDDQQPGPPLDETTIARIGLDVLDGLDAVHRAGIVHRDVKPDNILIAGDLAADDYTVFLVDFGIAKISGGRPVTEQHNVVGTPAYIAPERLGSGQVGPAADLWSLGVTLYVAIDGAPPFRSEGEFQTTSTRQAILNDPPLPLQRRSALAGIILRLLVKDPNQRADADEVRMALTAIAYRATQTYQPTVLDAATPSGADEPGTGGHQEKPPRVAATVPYTVPYTTPYPEPATGNGRGHTVPYPRLPPGGPPFRARMRVEDVRELILRVGTDTGVAMLLSIDAQDAAAILAGCPDRASSDLLAGIASAQPVTASTLMEMLSTADAARLLEHLAGGAAAVILAGMPPRAAIRILDRTSSQTAARDVKSMPARHAVRLFKAMSVQRAAAVLVHFKPSVAAAVLRADAGFKNAVLPRIPETERARIVRCLANSPDGPELAG